ncbi:SpaA isopeptide-forming pilin-related protein [[Eubacterium] siraeum]|nr:SpaA isopeptide-forming pilin-related protein [[Eubacterium] siraeum]
MYEYGSPEGYSVNRASQTITISRDKTSSVSFMNSEDSGTAQIKKVWLSDTTLSASEIANLEKNVYFTVKDANGKYIKVTGSAGAYVYAGTQTSANNMKLRGSKFNVSKLPMGTYTVTEINNASGYNPKTQTKTVTIANKGEIKAISFTNKSTPVVVIRKHFSDENNLTEAQLKEQYAKVTVNLQVLGFSGSVSSNPPAGYYVEFTGSNGNYTYKGLSSTKTSATDLKLNENGEMTISFGTNTTPYYLAVIETYSGTDYDVDNRDQRIDLGNGDPNAVIDLDDIELDNQLKTGSVQIDKQFLNENGAIENIPDDKLAEVAFKIKHNGKYLTFTGSDGIYTYKGENNTGTELKLNKSTYNFVANELPAREEYTVYEVSGTTGYSFSIDPVTFTITPAGSVKKVFTNKAMTGTISIVKHSADGVLSGWQFRVTGTAKTGQSYDKTFTTDAKGTITISNIRIGDYKVTEVKTGKTVGYITENSKDLEVKTDTVTTVNIENKPYANIVINKVDAKTGEKVSGATFGIYTDAECEIPAEAYTSATDDTLTDAVITESATGKYTCNFLPIESKNGTTYYVKELIAPEGYYLDTNVHAVTLKTANATVSVNNEIGKSDFNEYPYGHGAVIKEWKLDNGTADMTADEIAQMKAELEKSLYFTVKDRNGKYITATGADGIYTYNGDSTSEFRYTLKNSTFAIAELPTGDYTVTEFSTLSDYTIKSENPVKITVVRNQTAKATFVNERDTGTGKVIKVWKQFDTMTAAEQAEIENNVYFTVTDSNGAYLKVKENSGNYIYCGSQKTETKFVLKNGTFAIAELPTGDYTVTEYNNAKDYSPKQQTQKIKITKNTVAELTFTNVRDTGTGKIIKVWKQFDTMTATEQAEIENNVYFTVTDSNGAYLKVKENSGSYIYCGTQKTETKFVLKNGTFAIAELPTGDYTVTEYNNARDYSPKQQTQKIKVVRNQTAKATFVNERDTGNASIVKKWTNPNGLTTAQKAELEKNVYFTVKNADGAYLNAVSKNGKYVYNGSQTAEARFMLTNGKFELTELPTGKYTITEISNAEGYLPKTQVKTITVTKDATASAEFVNKVIVGNVTLTKVDEDYPENKLTGAVFTVYKSDKKTVVGTMKETETGVYSLEGLVYGEYYVQETKAHEYFVRDVNFYYFQIVNDGETVEVSNDELGKGTFINSPQKGEIKIVKTSYDNKVEGIHFEVTGKTYTGQSFSKIYTTDENGIIHITDLRAGEYNIHEVADDASAGYLLPDDKQLTIDRDGAKLVAEMHNSKLPDNPPTGASEDSFTQTAVIIISMVMMSTGIVLAFPLSKRKRKR